MDIITIATLIYLANGFGIWCLAYQMDKDNTKGLGCMLACVLLYPLSLVVAIFLTIVEAW